MELRQSRISLYVADVLVTSSVETQLCFGTAWLGVAEEPMAITALADLQGKGLSVLCSSAFHCETFEVRPYPCYYVCIPAEVGEGSLLLVQVAVRECLRCIDRPDISCSLQRDSRLSEWLQRKFPAKLFNPLDYSNHFYEYTAGQCLGASRATAPQKPETKAEVSRPMNTLDKLASMFENVSAGRRSKKAGRSG